MKTLNKILLAAGVLGGSVAAHQREDLAQAIPYASVQFQTAVPAAFNSSVAKGLREAVKAPLYVANYALASPEAGDERVEILVNKTVNQAAVLRNKKLDTVYTVSTGAVHKPTKSRYGEYVTPNGEYLVKGRRDPAALAKKFTNPEYYGAGQILLIGPFGGDIALHGTNKKETLGRYETNGCVRFDNKTMDELLRTVPIGSIVRISDLPQQAWNDTIAKYGGKK